MSDTPGRRAVNSIVWTVLLLALLVAMIGVIGAFTDGFGQFDDPGPDASLVVTGETQNDSTPGQLLVRIEHDGTAELAVKQLRIELWTDGERFARFHGTGGVSPSDLLVAHDGQTPPDAALAPGEQLQLVEADGANYDAIDPGANYRVVVRHAPSNATLGNATVGVGTET